MRTSELLPLNETRLASLEVLEKLRKQPDVEKQFASHPSDAVLRLTAARLQLLEKLKAQYENLVRALVQLEGDKRQYLDKAEEVDGCLAEQLLGFGIRSCPSSSGETVTNLPAGLRWVFGGDHWLEFARAMRWIVARMPVRSMGIVLKIKQRRLALARKLERRRERRETATAEDLQESPGEVVSVDPDDEEEMDLGASGEQTRALLRLLSCLGVAAAIFVFWSRTIPMLEVIDSVAIERPIRVGDVVTVEGMTGTVTKIHMRATTITNWDRQEFVVPNKTLITNTLLNWTLSASLNRILIPVGVAYGSDTEKARQILRDVAADHPCVLDDPAPMATFEQFADSSLSLVLRAYLPDIENRVGTITDLHTEIDKRFAAAGIEIAFPQQDIHLRSGWDDTCRQSPGATEVG